MKGDLFFITSMCCKRVPRGKKRKMSLYLMEPSHKSIEVVVGEEIP